ncbi:MAG: TolC family protein [Gemmatimonadota bacterium]
MTRFAMAVAGLLAFPVSGHAQAVDSLRLDRLLEEALQADPRQRLLGLQASESGLKDRNLTSGYLPSLSVTGQAQHQSDVFTFPFTLPGGLKPPEARKTTYDASLHIEQAIYDPSIGLKRSVEQAGLARSQAAVVASLYGIRLQVEAAFFTVAMAEQRGIELQTTIAGLSARLAEAGSRFRAGTALSGDTAMIAATILLRRQDILQVNADRRAALARLSVLLGRPVNDSAVVVLPDLAAAARAAAATADTTTARPEFAQFAALREQLSRQAGAEGAVLRPRLSLFGRLGYGLPGLDPLNTSFKGYWIIGAQVSWAPFDWGSAGRRREAFELEREMVAINQAAFARDLRASMQQDLATLERLTATLALDEQIVALREKTEHEAQVRLAEGAVTASEYVDRNTELLSARLDRAQHRVELARSQSDLITLLGAEAR